MNRLSAEKRKQILNLLVEGNSLRATARIADVSLTTVKRYSVQAGKACMNFHDQTIVGIKSQFIQCDEMWSFVFSKQEHTPDELKGTGVGDVWLWVGIDANTKLVISWHVGNRDAIAAYNFMQDLHHRVKGRVQLTADGFRAYKEAIRKTFGRDADYGQLDKQYEIKKRQANRQVYIGSVKRKIAGNPDERFISTSFVERQNLTLRMSCRRFTRKTNGFSKKFENHCYATALHFVYYNFVRVHQSLSVTPAMQAGITKRLMKLQDLVELIG